MYDLHDSDIVKIVRLVLTNWLFLVNKTPPELKGRFMEIQGNAKINE